MGNARPGTLLFVLVAVVPVVVGLALLAAVLLQRAGFGFLVWGLLPFGVSMLLIGALGVVLGRAATRGGSGGRSHEDDGV